MGWDEVLSVREGIEQDWRVRADEAAFSLFEAMKCLEDVVAWSHGVIEYSPWPPPADSVFAEMWDYVDAAEKSMREIGFRLNTWKEADFDE